MRPDAFQKQLNYRQEQLSPNLVRVHIPTLAYETFDYSGRKVLPWKMLSLYESVNQYIGWNFADDTDVDGYPMLVTLFAKLEFSQEFYHKDSPKYPLIIELKHDYLRTTSKCLNMSVRHPDVKVPYLVLSSIDVKLDSQTRKPKPYPETWRDRGIPTELSKPMKHVFPLRPENAVLTTGHKVHFSDTDSNQHANFTFYIRVCYDSFHENIVKHKYDPKASSLMEAGIKTIEVTYKQEALMGDVITVASWVESDNDTVYYFELLQNDQTYCMVTFEFFRATAAEEFSVKGRL